MPYGYYVVMGYVLWSVLCYGLRSTVCDLLHKLYGTFYFLFFVMYSKSLNSRLRTAVRYAVHSTKSRRVVELFKSSNSINVISMILDTNFEK